jgi:hypothetical protein
VPCWLIPHRLHQAEVCPQGCWVGCVHSLLHCCPGPGLPEQHPDGRHKGEVLLEAICDMGGGGPGVHSEYAGALCAQQQAGASLCAACGPHARLYASVLQYIVWSVQQLQV